MSDAGHIRPRGSFVALAVLLAVFAAGVLVARVGLKRAPLPLPPSASSPWPLPGTPIDPALADAGAALFARACAACHTLGGGRLAGPDLAGVLERRTAPWIRGMVLAPDSMLAVDPDARALLAEYATPMRDVGLTERDLRALVEHMRAAGGRATP